MKNIKALAQQENAHLGPSLPSQLPARRKLKIENLGDPWRHKNCSGIRLKGQWLAQAGFHPGQHVAVTFISPGMMQLSSNNQLVAAEASGPLPDFWVVSRGTFSLFKPLTERAHSWLEAHCPQNADHCYFAGALVVEARYVGGLLQHAEEDGLVINL